MLTLDQDGALSHLTSSYKAGMQKWKKLFFQEILLDWRQPICKTGLEVE